MSTAKPKPPTRAESAEALATTGLRLRYRKPWLVYLPTVFAFVLLNYLVASTETDESGRYRILPDYVRDAAEDRDNALRDGEVPEFDPFLLFEEHVVGFMFRLGTGLYGGMENVQLVLVAAWLIHLFELGICVRICYSCRASFMATMRYCFCTATAGFAQLVPLFRAREQYLEELEAYRKSTAAAAGGAAKGDGSKDPIAKKKE